MSRLNKTKKFENKSLKDLTFKRLFRRNKDGISKADFHEKCDNHTDTLLIIKTTKDRIFGAFTTKIWNRNQFSTDDGNAVGFSFASNKIYPIINGELAIFNDHTELEFVVLFYFFPTFVINGITYYLDIVMKELQKNMKLTEEKKAFKLKSLKYFKLCSENKFIFSYLKIAYNKIKFPI